MYQYQATVVSVHDGDTFHLDVDLGFQVHQVFMDMRVFGYDAPELGRPDGLGEQARDALKAWLSAHPGPYVVETVRDRTEKYGRYLVARLSSGGEDLIAAQVAAGWLKPYSGSGPKPTWP